MIYRPCPCGGEGDVFATQPRDGVAWFECRRCGGIYTVSAQKNGVLREIKGPVGGRA